MDRKGSNRKNLEKHGKDCTRISFKVESLNLKPTAKVTNLNAYHVLGGQCKH